VCAKDLVALTPDLEALLTSVKNLAAGHGNIFSLISQISAFSASLTTAQTACDTDLTTCFTGLAILSSDEIVANYNSNVSTINADLVELKNPSGSYLNGGKALGEIERLLTGCRD
jgi:hypothetical protein